MSVSGVSENIYPANFEHIQYPNLVIVRSIGDGACFFHSILRAYHPEYIQAISLSQRKKIAYRFRHALANVLGETAFEKDGNYVTYYDLLSRGELKEISKSVPEVSLKGMQKQLRDIHFPVDDSFAELISTQLKKDIYIIEATHGDVYMQADTELLHKGNDAVVILYSPGHYDVVGIYDEKSGIVDCLFDSDHPLIIKIKKRIQNIKDLGSKRQRNIRPIFKIEKSLSQLRL